MTYAISPSDMAILRGAGVSEDDITHSVKVAEKALEIARQHPMRGENMKAAKEERIKALEVALNNESRERDFYLKHSVRTTSPLGRSMFQTLANDEAEHYQRILALHESLKKEGKWPDTIPLTVKNTEIRSILRDMLASVEHTPAANRDDVDAIKIAVDFEANGVSFYEKLRENADEPLEKEFYGMLASIEREHFLSLQEALEYFQDPAVWYLTKEKPHIDGG